VKDAIHSAEAPAAIGPYSQAVRAGPWVFISGQIPLDPITGAIVIGGVAEQTRQVCENLGAILRAAEGTFAHVVKTTVYLADLDDFAAMNEVYGTFFPPPAPARATIQAARLPRDVRVEIDAIALLSAPADPSR
jgi:2-iminobutanoate/2-iminopropanoate deaminase